MGIQQFPSPSTNVKLIPITSLTAAVTQTVVGTWYTAFNVTATKGRATDIDVLQSDDATKNRYQECRITIDGGSPIVIMTAGVDATSKDALLKAFRTTLGPIYRANSDYVDFETSLLVEVRQATGGAASTLVNCALFYSKRA